jgi:hypothetical protein
MDHGHCATDQGRAARISARLLDDRGSQRLDRTPLNPDIGKADDSAQFGLSGASCFGFRDQSDGHEWRAKQNSILTHRTEIRRLRKFPHPHEFVGVKNSSGIGHSALRTECPAKCCRSKQDFVGSFAWGQAIRESERHHFIRISGKTFSFV